MRISEEGLKALAANMHWHDQLDHLAARLEDKPDYYTHHPLLDHGYIRLVDAFGSDKLIVRAARMSTKKGFIQWDPGTCPHCKGVGHVPKYPEPGEIETDELCFMCEGKGEVAGDMKLLSYLYSNHHDTPFEMAGLLIEVQAPIFVFREWHRHRTQSYNELSARYTPLPDVNYVPTLERLMINAGGTNKQAGTVKGSAKLTEAAALAFQIGLRTQYDTSEAFYQWALSVGVPKELARCGLPVGRYSRMMASANLRNWLGFLTLRNSTFAQWEIREYAKVVAELVAAAFPRTHELFVSGRK